MGASTPAFSAVWVNRAQLSRIMRTIGSFAARGLLFTGVGLFLLKAE